LPRSNAERGGDMGTIEECRNAQLEMIRDLLHTCRQH
jgi:hypothetical protein